MADGILIRCSLTLLSYGDIILTRHPSFIFMWNLIVTMNLALMVQQTQENLL